MTTNKRIVTLNVDMGDGACASVPRLTGDGDLGWLMRYYSGPEYKLDAAGVLDTFCYLILECTQREQIRRIQLMKAAILEDAGKERTERGL